ncbi:MAG: alpha/beta hydrolase [Pseudomonadota bacterium]
MPEDIHFKSRDGLSLFAKSYGDQTAALTVLCMHGLTRNHKDFEPMIAGLSGPHRYIAVDVRGRGRSQHDPDPTRYTPPVYAEDMGVLLDTLKIEKAALIGTSMGGLMAMIMMHTMPDRILGTVLNDVGPVVDPAGLARIAGYVGEVEALPDWDAAANAVAKAQRDVFPDFGPEDWQAFASRAYRETDTGAVILDYDPAISRAIADTKPTFKTRFAMWRLFTKMKKRPLLVTRGERSDVLHPSTAARMMKRHTSAKLVTIPGVGHAPLLNEPQALTAIEAFLSQIAASQS